MLLVQHAPAPPQPGRARRRRPGLRTPTWLARLVLGVGAMTVLSALVPAMRDRSEVVNGLVPGVVPAAATTGTAAVGVILVLLAAAVRRGKYRAWLLATLLSGVAAVLHLLKGLDVEEAAVCLGLIVLLATSRARFTARPDPRSSTRLAMVLALGPLVATALGWCWLAMDVDGQAPGTTALDRLAQAFLGLVGVSGPVGFVDAGESVRASVALVVLGAGVLLVAALVGLAPVDGPHSLTADERGTVRSLLAGYGAADSLAYFSLRDDRAAVFSPSAKAAVSYRVIGAVSLAAGDPVGDPEAWPGAIKAWLDETRAYGQVPAVLAAGEAGAEAYARAGLDALEIGDEAVIDVGAFTLAGRSMRAVRQAVARCDRAGLVVSCHRVADLSAETMAALAARSDQWRDGPVERGFSMALGRLGAAEDGRAVVVLTRDGAGELRGLLHFVPWGEDGLSLDLMRRDRSAENGIIEHLVAGLLTAAPGLGVSRVSLNFAVFRAVLARGERVGAGPVLRLQRSLLLWLSRFWQIESLYRANAKYHPTWVPRFICFRSAADLPRVSIAALRAEAFLVAPHLLPWRVPHD